MDVFTKTGVFSNDICGIGNMVAKDVEPVSDGK
jgi:hypothetical protein